jgi:hypothetical protein
MTRHPAFSTVPISWEHIEEHLSQPKVAQARRDRLGRKVIRKQELDRLKAVSGSRVEPVKKIVLTVHHGQVGSESGHIRIVP